MNISQTIEYQTDNFFSFEYSMNGFDLKRLRKAKKLSQRELFEATGIPVGTIGRLESTGADIIKIETLNAINKFFKIEHSVAAEEKHSYELNEGNVSPGYNNKRPESNSTRIIMPSENGNMYLVPIRAYGGFLTGYERKVYEKTLQRVSFPLVRGECFAFEIEGFSMAPEFNPGDWFVGSPIEGLDWLVKGRPYVFQTIDGLIVKNFEKIEEDFAHLYSVNNDYNPVKPIYLKEIKKIYHKEAIIKL